MCTASTTDAFTRSPAAMPPPAIAGSYPYLALEKVHFGRPAAEGLAEEAEHRQARRIVVVASRSLLRLGAIHAATRQIDHRMAGLFADCREHTPRESVLALATQLRELDADLVISIGGGTVIDTVKLALLCIAARITRVDEFDAWRVRMGDDGSRIVPAVPDPPLRQIAVPTTLSAAEFSDLAGCTDTASGEKHLYTGRHIGPAAVVLDPAMTVHTPERLWLSTGVRALDHAIESICSPGHQPLTDATCLHAIDMLAAALPANRQKPFDLDGRLASQMGVWLAASGINRVDFGASHGIGHALGGALGIPHGLTSCVLLPTVLAFNERACADRQALIVKAFAQPGMRASTLVRKLIASLGLPTRLRELVPDTSAFDDIAVKALANPWVRSNPEPITQASQVRAILEAAW